MHLLGSEVAFWLMCFKITPKIIENESDDFEIYQLICYYISQFLQSICSIGPYFVLIKFAMIYDLGFAERSSEIVVSKQATWI